MLKLWKPAPSSHEDLFLERYQRLLAWSLKLTANDRQLAEDLLHDTFVQFTFSRPSLDTIRDVDSYLYAMVRNSHVSHLRRAHHVRTTSLSMIQFDSLEVGLRVTDVQDQIKVQDELRLICHYASLRKESSKGASVLILRFFHGYYPSEIAQVLHSNWLAVTKWLQRIRAEAALYLEDPEALSFIKNAASQPLPPLGFARSIEDLLDELRQMIFSARRGRCLSQTQLRELYRGAEGNPIDHTTLAHMVSCPECLDRANRFLGLPLLNQRYPTDMTGRQRGPKGGPGGDPPSPTGADSDQTARSFRRLKETFEHRPKELRIAVNGFLQVSQKVSSDRMEQTLSLDLEEKPDFVEVFSEQWIRLLFLDVDPPLGGDLEQQRRIELSQGRSLAATINFSGPCPDLQVIYEDPTLTAVESEAVSLESEFEAMGVSSTGVQSATSNDGKNELPSTTSKEQSLPLKFATLLRRVRRRRSDFRPWTWDFGLLLRPGTITALFALVLIAAALMYLRPPLTPLSAPELLQRSTAAEEAIAAGQVLHRTISFEEKNAAGELIARRRIEVWQSAEKGITARRLYDDNGQLVAGDWRRADGVQTLYNHGRRPQLELAPEKRGSASLAFNDIWQTEISAREFTQLIGNSAGARVEELSNTYLISYDTGNSGGLIRASLILSRADLRAIEETLLVRQDDEVREYKFSEATFERHALSAVPPAVFEPDLEFLSPTRLETPNSTPTTELAPDTRHPTPIVATAALEVEVIDLLNRAGAFTGEQIDVSRTADGRLEVNALVETDKRKAELLAALASVRNNSAVRINIETVAEAQARESRNKKQGSQTQGRITVDQFTATENPVFNELRKRFSEAEAQAFADRIIRRSLQARDHATALRKISERFSAKDLASLAAADRLRWLGLLRGHAKEFLVANEALQRELQTVFHDTGGGDSSPTLDTDREIQAAIRELYGLSVACDEDLRASFSRFSTAAGAEVKTAKFWRALNTASALARSIQSAR